MEDKSYDIDILLNTIELVLDIKHHNFKGIPSCGPKMLKFFNQTVDVHNLVKNAMQIKGINKILSEIDCGSIKSTI